MEEIEQRGKDGLYSGSVTTSMDLDGASHIIVRMVGITKHFGAVEVLRDVGFEIRAGEVHILAGENGAGKSTLIKILAGVYADYDGQIVLCGKPFAPRGPIEASEAGVAVIHQELSLVPSMSVADNIFLGRAPTRAGFVKFQSQRRDAAAVLRKVGLEIDVDECVEAYPIGVQQVIEIAKALSQDARVIVMDEPTSALKAPEVERLFGLIEQLKQRGCGIVYITHKMEEIERIGDRISVLRDGRCVGSALSDELARDQLIEWMVGRRVEERFPRHIPHLGEERLRVEKFSVYPRGMSGLPVVIDVSFTLRAGEILGIGGLQGSGASELLMGLFGAYGADTRGSVHINGERVGIETPSEAVRHGIALLTNDRKTSGLVPNGSIVRNTVLADLNRLSSMLGWCSDARERNATRTVTEPLKLRAASLDLPVETLSGGNQQKVVLAKWLQTGPRLMLFDEPTRGIDVGAKLEIYGLMNEWTSQGIAILMTTSEMPELLAMSDRILVLHRGVATAEFAAGEATASKVLAAAMGQVEERMAV